MRPKSITVSEPTETMKLIEYVNRNGLTAAAKVYGTNPASLSRWIRKQGYQMVREYRKAQVTA